ncbi:MAG: tungsten formylmethanofuran dehydrogenase [Ignavibacteria bacterium]|nr:tungsten formylmethanofuran dehydrogenase [Bacteroidota bacterium]MSQ45761.1 tungsten formylmethanofuran dehydrogenase [Ignavibacteria bacterium]
MKSKLSNEKLVSAYRTMLLSRLIDEKEMILLKQGKILFHISGPGHEACQVAIAMAMKPGIDWAYPYYRDLAFSLQFGVTVDEILTENMNRAAGPSSKGRQMPSHYGNKNLRIVAQSSPTGTQFLQAAGTAMGIQIAQSDEIVYVSSGEGATSEGEFTEAVAWSSRAKFPVIFMVQNNKYAISVPLKDQVAGGSVSHLYSTYPNLKCIKYDGTNLEESYNASAEAVEWVRSGNGPAMLEADVVRLFPHSSSDDQKKYRIESELVEDKKRDPVTKLKNILIENKILTEIQLDELYKEIKTNIDKVADVAESMPQPDPSTVMRNIYSPNIIIPKENFTEPEHSGKSVVLVDAINHSLHEEMKRNEKIIIYGEDIADGKGGVFTATKGLSTTFGTKRVFNSPIAEASIVGTAVGLAIKGFKPVVEIQFGDYIWPAFMQFKDEVACLRYRSDGDFSCPMVVRVAVGGYIRGGLYHSQCIESIFAHIPGIWIAFPSNAADAKGLLKTAMREENPILFCEHKGLYRQQFAASPEPDENYCLPFGLAKIKKVGTDITIVTYGFLVQRSLEAARKMEEIGISCEVIDLRTIIPWDKETVLNSVKKTGKVIVAHEDSRTAGFGAEIVSTIAEECFQYLDAPITRVAAIDSPVPFAPVLEDVTLPQERNITEAIQKLIQY